MQPTFDNLYEQSCKGLPFTDLMQYITSENNISKPNGKTRPLGIPCIEDRIIQQCIKQVIEPICEARFHKHSYGFRPNRSTEHAIARSMFLMNMNKLHYVVDVDIKGFFDNVNHAKLKKQLWTLGIQDKNLLSIIGKILQSEIQGIGVPTKGTPQGGIISPLLANVVLNELDWWISSQWETFETKHKYTRCHKYDALKKSAKLKEICLVRYADDFKLFCREAKTAQKVYVAVKDWLKERLDLDISPDKSKVTNLRRNYTEFLGFKLIVKPKKKKYICQSRMCNKAVQSTIRKLKEQIKKIQKNNNSKEVSKINSMILGSHNYYNSATNAILDFGYINFLVTKNLDIRLKDCITNKPKYSETYKRLYGEYNGKTRTIQDITLFSIYGCKTKPPMCFTQEVCNYTKKGRDIIHNNLHYGTSLVNRYLMKGNEYMSAQLFDNSISLIAGQRGVCHITKVGLEIGNMECHHKLPKCLGGTDEYKNLVWLYFEAHKLVYATEQDTINKYLEVLNLDEKGLKRLNTLRKLVGNSVI
ncbi:MAG: group II intron reverse transcriptase [Sarcina sp.]